MATEHGGLRSSLQLVPTLLSIASLGAGAILSLAQTKTNAEAIQRLAERSKETGSDAVVVYSHDEKIFEYHSKRKPEALALMSCTKSIVALAVGEAIAEGRIKGVDQPVGDFYPEWKQGRKQLVTVRHLLTQTSGLQHVGTGYEIYPAPDSVRLALAAELSSAPGSAFSYNNKATNLLSGIIHVATGSPLDIYVLDRFLAPMGIKNWHWEKDGAGNPYAFADLALDAEDFAKFGRLVLQKGMWDGKQLVPAVWIEQLGQQSQPFEPLYGLLWWRLPTAALGIVTAARLEELRKSGVGPPVIAQLTTLEDKPVHSLSEWHKLLAATLGPHWEDFVVFPIGPYGSDIPAWSYGGFDGLAAVGYLGQYLVVFPDRGLVGVRQIQGFDGYDFLRNRFEDFADLVRNLSPSTPYP
jgi:CubicO group peptidase (beta-lactamase class C family)